MQEINAVFDMDNDFPQHLKKILLKEKNFKWHNRLKTLWSQNQQAGLLMFNGSIYYVLYLQILRFYLGGQTDS